MADTRATLAAWNRDPWRVLGRWVGWSLLTAVALLGAVYLVAHQAEPDPTRLALPGVNVPVRLRDFGHLLLRNGLVLALHAMACAAGFIAGSSMPQQAAQRSGLSKAVHERAGTLAIAFVCCATAFSLATQAYVLGHALSTLASQFRMSQALLLVGFPQRGPRADRAVPAARSMGRGQQARTLGGAAGGHVRDGGRRVARADRERARRAVRLAAPDHRARVGLTKKRAAPPWRGRSDTASAVAAGYFLHFDFALFLTTELSE